MKIKLFFIAAAMVLLAGCVGPTQEEITAFNYGTSVPDDYQTQINSYLQSTLLDPYSAHVDLGTPIKFWCQESVLNQIYPGQKLKRWSGWMVTASVNAKNVFGGYTGGKPYGFLFHDGLLVKVFRPNDWINYKTSLD